MWGKLELKPHPYLLFRVGLLELAVVYFAVTYALEVRGSCDDHVIIRCTHEGSCESLIRDHVMHS